MTESRTARRALTAVIVPIAAAAASACPADDTEGPDPEVEETTISLDLPAIPEFDMPSPNPDGTHSVREIRLQGGEFLDTEIEVKGYVVWDYDCATAMRTPDMTDEDVEELVSEQPELCERPNFYLGKSADAEPEQGIWVVEVPREPRPDERRNLPASELAEWPDVPEYEVGDQIVVTGEWALTSPRGAASSEGLLVYEELEHVDD